MNARRTAAILTGTALAILVQPATTAVAGLGRPVNSVEDDRVALRAQRTSSTYASYTRHELTLPNGGMVKEFSRADGAVFAVTWNAPGRPDLRQLLGEHFATMQEENATRTGRRMRRPLAVNRSELLLQTGGRPGAFWGVAVVPALEPEGFVPGDLQ